MMRWLSIALVVLLASNCVAQDDQLRHDVLRRLASSEHRLNFAVAAARISTGINAERAYRDLDTMLAREYGDMFWMYGLAGFYCSTKDILSDALKSEIRKAWKYRTPYRGDTENHFLMYYGSLFLMSDVWPDLPGSEWFTGQSSSEINAESKEYLLYWIDQVSKYGLNEFDSPRYQYYFFTPVILLANYASDPEVRSKSSMLLELMLADYAVKYVDGNFVGAHSRTFEAAALTAHIGEIGAYGQYFFEDTVTNLQPDLAFVALTSYSCPSIIKTIAKEKSYPFELFESKRQRPAIRYINSDEPVLKYTHLTQDYSLGSLSLGLVQPIQQQSWKLAFHDNRTPNSITGLHPYISAKELATYFPEEPSFQAERIEGTKAGYSSENKWIGGSPYQRLTQEKNVLYAYCDIPDSVNSQHADIFLPAHVEWKHAVSDSVKLSPGKWYQFSYEANELALYFDRTDFLLTKESNGYRLRSLSPTAGYALVAGKTSRVDRVSIASKLRTGASKWKRVNKRAKTDSARYLYRSPYLNSVRGCGVITITHGKQKHTLNFGTGQALER
jgi:hypothetical protein